MDYRAVYLAETANAVTPVPANVVLSTLIAFVCVYTFFLGAFFVYGGRVLRRGPEPTPEQAKPTGSLKPALTAAVFHAHWAE
jgi:cytochrome d ubiquinol oxidase subunit I